VKRFGVSLPEDLAKAVEKLSEELGTTRSAVVAQAVSNFLSAYSQHLKDGHRCMGAVLAITKGVEDVNEALERYRELIVNFSHMHVEGKCVSVFVVYGDGKKIGEFLMAISERADKAYFTPLE
jgi:CopG family nickel-responsive transcriptional regulator